MERRRQSSFPLRTSKKNIRRAPSQNSDFDSNAQERRQAYVEICKAQPPPVRIDWKLVSLMDRRQLHIDMSEQDEDHNQLMALVLRSKKIVSSIESLHFSCEMRTKQSISKKNKRMQSIQSGWAKLNNTLSKLIAFQLPSMKVLIKLEFTGIPAACLSNALLCKGLLSAKALQVLRFTNVQLGDHGLNDLAVALHETPLLELSMKTVAIGDKGAHVLSNTIKIQNERRASAAWEAGLVSDKFSPHRPTLVSVQASGLLILDLSHNRLTDEGAELLGSALLHDAWLLALNLERNSIGMCGLKSLADALQTNRSLRCIRLKDNPCSSFDQMQSNLSKGHGLIPNRTDREKNKCSLCGILLFKGERVLCCKSCPSLFCQQCTSEHVPQNWLEWGGHISRLQGCCQLEKAVLKRKHPAEEYLRNMLLKTIKEWLCIESLPPDYSIAFEGQNSSQKIMPSTINVLAHVDEFLQPEHDLESLSETSKLRSWSVQSQETGLISTHNHCFYEDKGNKSLVTQSSQSLEQEIPKIFFRERLTHCQPSKLRSWSVESKETGLISSDEHYFYEDKENKSLSTQSNQSLEEELPKIFFRKRLKHYQTQHSTSSRNSDFDQRNTSLSSLSSAGKFSANDIGREKREVSRSSSRSTEKFEQSDLNHIFQVRPQQRTKDKRSIEDDQLAAALQATIQSLSEKLGGLESKMKDLLGNPEMGTAQNEEQNTFGQRQLTVQSLEHFNSNFDYDEGSDRDSFSSGASHDSISNIAEQLSKDLDI